METFPISIASLHSLFFFIKFMQIYCAWSLKFYASVLAYSIADYKLSPSAFVEKVTERKSWRSYSSTSTMYEISVGSQLTLQSSNPNKRSENEIFFMLL